MILSRQRIFWSVNLGHLTNDVFMSMGVVILTFLSGSILPMSNAQIGLAVSLQQITGALSQPFFGRRADRTGGRGLGAGGLAWVVLMALIALALAVMTRNYALMLIPFILQGLGSGALHPVGSLYAASANPARSATNVSIFFLMGQLGLALGPALVGALLDASNVDRLRPFTDAVGWPGLTAYNAQVTPIFFLGLLSLPAIAGMLATIPRYRPVAGSKNKADGLNLRNLPWMALSTLGLLVVLRGLAQPGSVNFIPALFKAKGWTPAEYGLITSSFWIASGLSGVFFGWLADRYDRRWVILFSMVASAPAFFFLPVLDGAPAFAMAILAGGFSGGAHSLLVVLAQGLIPNSKGFASGAILGFIFGTGALGSLLIGYLADGIGLTATFQIVAVAAALSGLMALTLPRRQTG